MGAERRHPDQGDRWSLPLCLDSHHAQVVRLPEGGGERRDPAGRHRARRRLHLSRARRLHRVGAVEALRFELRDAAGAVVAAAEVEVPAAARVDQPFGTPDFRVLLHEGAVVSVELTSPVTDPDGRFCVSARASGRAELWLHWASLMPEDALDGLHAGIVELFRELPANLVKYPGGCFADGYDWRAGVGPRDARFAAANQAWGIWEENDFGTDEFLRWCELTARDAVPVRQPRHRLAGARGGLGRVLQRRRHDALGRRARPQRPP